MIKFNFTNIFINFAIKLTVEIFDRVDYFVALYVWRNEHYLPEFARVNKFSIKLKN